MTRRSIGWLGAGLAVVLVAGCALLPPDGLQVTLPAVDTIDPLPVTVVDNAGIVVGAAPGEGSFLDDETAVAIEAVPGRDDAVWVNWLGGACDDRVTITIDPEGDQFRVATRTQPDVTILACPAVGIFRSVLLELTGPMGVDAFVTF